MNRQYKIEVTRLDESGGIVGLERTEYFENIEDTRKFYTEMKSYHYDNGRAMYSPKLYLLAYKYIENANAFFANWDA